jgi:hypothetical protein
MEIFCQLEYNKGHETPWEPRAAGKAASGGCSFVKDGQEPASHSTRFKCFCKFRVPVASGLPGERGWRTEAPADTRTSPQVDPRSKKAACSGAFKWPSGCRVSDRFMDLKPGSENDRPTVRRSISSESRVEASREPGVELSETRAASLTEKRRGDRALEAVSLAPYKKTPTDVGPIWFSSMNRASCSFRTLLAPGPRRDKHPSFTTFTNKIVFRPSMRWPYRRNGGVWLSTFSFGLGILRAWISGHFSSICFAIFEAPLFYYGTVERSIGGKRLNIISVSAFASRKNISLPMRRNLIRQNMFGTKRTVHSPMVPPRIWQSSRGSSGIQPGGSGNLRSSFGLVSMHLICLGLDNSFHYLCKVQ